MAETHGGAETHEARLLELADEERAHLAGLPDGAAIVRARFEARRDACLAGADALAALSASSARVAALEAADAKLLEAHQQLSVVAVPTMTEERAWALARAALLIEEARAELRAAPPAEPPPDVVAEAATLREYFRTTPATTLQGQPIADDYRLVFERTFRLLTALAAARDAEPAEAEQDDTAVTSQALDDEYGVGADPWAEGRRPWVR